MAGTISAGPVHHLKLTVSNLNQARDFYTNVLGFQVAAEFPGVTILSDSRNVLALGEAPDSTRAIPNDHFDENRVGLDHISFAMENRGELEKAVQVLDSYRVPHGEITDEGAAMQMYTLTFRDPDNIQLELTAPYSHWGLALA